MAARCAALLALLAPARGDDRPVHRPAFYWSEDNAKMYLNVLWSPTLDLKRDETDLFGDSGAIRQMDETEVFFDTQSLEVFAFNAKEGFHLAIPLRNRVVASASSWTPRDDGLGVDITLKKTRIGRWRQVQPLRGAVKIPKDAMQVKIDEQARYNIFDTMQNKELNDWMETYPYRCLACHVIFDEVYKGDSNSRSLWRAFRDPPPKPPKNSSRPHRAWRDYEQKIETEFEFDYICDRVMSMRATTFGTAAIVGSDVDFACNLIAGNHSIQKAFFQGYAYLHHHAHYSFPETAHFWDSGPPSLKQIVETAPDLIPEHRDLVCGEAAGACASVAHHEYVKCDACQAIVMLADGLLAYPRGDFPREREEVEELITDDYCGYPVKGRIGYHPVVSEVCEELLDDVEQELINTLTYKQRASQNEKIQPSAVPPAVMEFCATQTDYCKPPKRIPVKKHDPYVMTAEQVDKITEVVLLEAKNKKNLMLEHDEDTKKNREFDILHAKAVEGRTWVDDLPEGSKFKLTDEELEDTRSGRAKEVDAELNRAVAEAERMQAESAARNEL